MRGADPRYDFNYGNSTASYKKGSRPWFSFRKADQIPTAGALSYGMQSQWLAWRPLIGSAVGQAVQFRTIYNVFPLYQATGLAAQTGLGGIAQGQIVIQPLSDPYNGNY
jgi:hypothetical protein